MTTDTLNIARRCHSAQRLEVDWYLAGAVALLVLTVCAFAYLVCTSPVPVDEQSIAIITGR